MNFVSLFAGVGGFDLAFERAGMDCVGQVEIDAKCREVLHSHWPHVPKWSDIKEVDGGWFGSVDVLCGGFPCQDYSVAGRRGGLAGDRGALWWQFHRLIDECRPEWVVGENVPGLLSSSDGRDFGAIVGSLVELGYGVVWRVLDAQYFGVAQRRRRVFIVGHLGGIPRPEILAFAEGCTWDSPPRRETGSRVAALTANGLGGGGPDDNLAQAGHLIPALTAKSPAALDDQSTGQLIAAFARTCDQAGCNEPVFPNFDSTFCEQHQEYPEDRPPTLSFRTNQTGAQGPIHSIDVTDTLAEDHPPAIVASSVRRLTPLECERLQGFPDNWTAGQSDTQRYRQMGNAVAVPVAEWIGKQLVKSQ